MWRHKGSRHQRGYGKEWEAARSQALTRDKYLCQPCLTTGRTTPAKAVDHIKSLAKGGTHDLDNLQSICNECHDAKTAKEAAEAQGRSHRPRIKFDSQGQPIWPEGR